jgi:hypothetical protein
MVPRIVCSLDQGALLFLGGQVVKGCQHTGFEL